jgi:hypothetical protein
VGHVWFVLAGMLAGSVDGAAETEPRSADVEYQVAPGFKLGRTATGPNGTVAAFLIPDPWCGTEAAYEIREGQRVATFTAQGRLLWEAGARGILEIEDVFVQQDGRVLVWGLLMEGTARTARLSVLFRFSRQGLDGSFQALTPSDLADLRLTSVRLAADDSIEIEGSFTSIRGQPRAGRARLRPDGSLDD